MTAGKLIGRTEQMEWKPPALTFKIERHGASRAEVQNWEIDLVGETATLFVTGHRQIYQMDARLNVKPIAAEIASIVNEGREDHRIKRRGATYVRIKTADIIPATNKQTTAGRRKRFAEQLDLLLAPQGWRRKSAGSHLIFERGRSD
jgi:hypothetical protein